MRTRDILARVNPALRDTSVENAAAKAKPAGLLSTTGADGGTDWESIWTVLSVAGAGIGAYHGYKRNDSVGWAIGWSLLGGFAPIIVIPVAFAQGIGKRK